MPKSVPIRSISDQLRLAIRGSDLPLAWIAQDARLTVGVLQRFLASEDGLTLNLNALDRLADVLGLDLVVARRPLRPVVSRRRPSSYPVRSSDDRK